MAQSAAEELKKDRAKLRLFSKQIEDFQNPEQRQISRLIAGVAWGKKELLKKYNTKQEKLRKLMDESWREAEEAKLRAEIGDMEDLLVSFMQPVEEAKQAYQIELPLDF